MHTFKRFGMDIAAPSAARVIKTSSIILNYIVTDTSRVSIKLV